MFQNTTGERQIKCTNDKHLDKIAYCPYIDNCERTHKRKFPNAITVEKGAKSNERDNS